MLNLNFSPFPRLTTERLQLRELCKKDGHDIMVLRSDDRVNEYINRPKSIAIDDAVAFIDKIENSIKNNESVYWAVTQKTSDTLIGTICLWNISLERDMGEIGYELSPRFQGKGMMQEAVAAVIKFGFEQMGLK